MVINKYRIFFSIYGKKMQTLIEAETEFDAEVQLKNKICIDKIESIESHDNGKIRDSNDIFEVLKDMFDV